MQQAITRRPRYVPLAVEPGARFHLLLLESAEGAASAFATGSAPADYDELWTIERRSAAIPCDGEGARAHGFRAASHMLIALRRRLAHEQMGLRLHAAGSEHFLWDVARVAEEAGLGEDEYALAPCGAAGRRVFCVHCRTTNEGVAASLAECRGCGAMLFVRDHFSRRLNAFMGVQVDAEVPGERPDIEGRHV